MFSNGFRVVGAAGLTVVIVWALVLGWWQSNDHRPDSGELALYLLALPLALVGGYWLLRASIDQIKAKPGAGTATHAAVTDDDPLALPHAATAAAERGFSLRFIDAFVVAAGGASAEEILAAVESGKRPEPVPELINGAGFPVVAAVVGEVDVAAMAETLGGSQPGLRGLLEHEDALRALCLFDGVLRQACEAVVALLTEPLPRMRLQLLCLVPASWESSSFPALQAWIRSFDWPQVNAVDMEVQFLPVASDADAMRYVDEAILQANRDHAGDRLILVAGAISAAAQSSIDTWEARGNLFSSQHQDRPIPGEGAVAILLAPTATCDRLKVVDGVVISRVGHGIRDKSLQAGGRTGGTLIGELVAGLLEVREVAATDVVAAVLDTDHRAVHYAEMLEGLGTALAHLDPLKDCPATGTVNGVVTPLGGLIALACACHRAMTDKVPLLCLSNQHDRERAALLVTPARSSTPSEPCST